MPTHITNKVLSWLPEEEMEPLLKQQVIELSKHDAVFGHIAVMPDAHPGRGASVGLAIATKGAVIPAGIGGDVGCGMTAIRTDLVIPERDKLVEVWKAIQEQVPISPGHYNVSVRKTAAPRVSELEEMAQANSRLAFYNKTVPNWPKQLGSLGGGNHFIEVVADEEDRVWAFLHSGSRGTGYKIAAYHQKVAKQLMERYFIRDNDELAFLPVDSEEFDLYMQDIVWLQVWSRMNRAEMMERVLKLMEHRLGTFSTDMAIDCHHNFSQWENHFKENVIVSRKGAISAREGQYGLIPGSMGTSSYVVKGKGHAGSFCTAPHGAGRRMSRTAIRKEITMEQFATSMGDVVYQHDEKFMDEAPAAYKDINKVMEWSDDLVEVVHKFRPLLNVKGE